MVYAQIIQPPAFGARIKSINASAAEAMPGISILSFDQGNDITGRIIFIGVVSADLFALAKAVDAIEVDWESPNAPNQNELDELLDVQRVRDADDLQHTLVESGDIDAGVDNAKFELSSRYDSPFAAHAAMEPRSALAWVQSDKVEIWCGTQDSFFTRNRVAAAIGHEPDDVVVYPKRMGGGFGGRVLCQSSVQAALLSKAIGKPVRVQWSREAEFQNNYFQPSYSHIIDAGVTEQGEINHWKHDFVSSPILTGIAPKNVGRIIDLLMADHGTSRGALPPYRIENSNIRFSDIRTAVPIGPWRALGAAPNAFAIEGMIDELAYASGIDPLEFCLKNLSPQGERLANVLRRVAQISNWEALPKVNPAINFGRGIACSVYKQETPVAVVADMEVDQAAKTIQISKIWCAQDY